MSSSLITAILALVLWIGLGVWLGAKIGRFLRDLDEREERP